MTELLQLAAIIFLAVLPFCLIVVAAIRAGGDVEVVGISVKVRWGGMGKPETGNLKPEKTDGGENK